MLQCSKTKEQHFYCEFRHTQYMYNILVIEYVGNLLNSFYMLECVKTQLAVGGVCEAVVEVVRRHRNNPASDLSPPIIKTATDLIVLILVGGKSEEFYIFLLHFYSFIIIMILIFS